MKLALRRIRREVFPLTFHEMLAPVKYLKVKYLKHQNLKIQRNKQMLCKPNQR